LFCVATLRVVLQKKKILDRKTEENMDAAASVARASRIRARRERARRARERKTAVSSKKSISLRGEREEEGNNGTFARCFLSFFLSFLVLFIFSLKLFCIPRSRPTPQTTETTTTETKTTTKNELLARRAVTSHLRALNAYSKERGERWKSFWKRASKRQN
jgi:hypothetical protein